MRETSRVRKQPMGMKEVRYMTRTQSGTSLPVGKGAFRTTSRRCRFDRVRPETWTRIGTSCNARTAGSWTITGTVLLGSKQTETGTFPEVLLITFP